MRPRTHTPETLAGGGPAFACSDPPAPLEAAAIDAPILLALQEDRGGGDVTSETVLDREARARGRLVAKAPGRLAGVGVFARTFELCDPEVRVECLAQDGAAVVPGDVLVRLEGRAWALLTAERTALNFVQRMSGIATLTAAYVERAAGGARILDTRKTTPGLRLFEKYAVRCGGGENHRFGLFDEAMLKDNHLDLAGRGLGELVAQVRRTVGPGVRITAEARDRAEALAAAAGGADVVLLDNLDAGTMARLCPEVREAALRGAGRAVEIEASGGIDLQNVGAVAACGVDRISVGALTHSAPALDLSLTLEPVP